MENKFLNFNGWSEVLGVTFAGLAVLGGIAGGIFLLYNEKDLGGFAAILMPLGIIAGVFYRTRRRQAKQLTAKRTDGEQKGDRVR